MLNVSELKRRASKEGVPQAIMEKDFVLSVALNAIAESALSKYLVFKGGTAIRKVYFEEARFSEDLDFTVLNANREQVLKGLDEILGEKTLEGVKFEKPEEEPTRAGLKVALKYTGPLAHTQRIRFDFSFRENLVGDPLRKPLINSYGLSRNEILVLSLGELFAEKIHALGSRSAPRDLYDVWFLFGNGITLDHEIVEKKFAYYNEKLEKERITAAIEKMKTDWQRDLRPLLKNLPEFSKVESEMKKKLMEIF